jgi:hypothetical protein
VLSASADSILHIKMHQIVKNVLFENLFLKNLTFENVKKFVFLNCKQLSAFLKICNFKS